MTAAGGRGRRPAAGSPPSAPRLGLSAARGGPCARFGQLLSIKPIIDVGDGEVSMVDRVRTRRAAVDRVREKTYARGPLQSLAVLHTSNYETARALADEFATSIANLREPIIVCKATTAVGTHVGPNGLGIAAIVAE